MAETVRAFVSISIPDDLKQGIGSLLERLKRADLFSIRWVKADTVHVTLKFLGDVETGRLEPILKSLKGALAGVEPFSMQVRGMGVFPNPSFPRVIWLGLTDNLDRMRDLVGRVNRALQEFGFERDEQGFQPHLTLGRVKSLVQKGTLIRKIQEFKDLEIGSLMVDRIFLMKSDLNPGGASHTPLGEIPF